MTISLRAALLITTAVPVFALRSDARRPASVAAVPALLSLTANTNSVVGSTPVVLVLQLSEPAGIAGFVVALSSSASVISVPASVTIPKGATSFPVTATSTPVAASALATITATSNGTRKTVDIRVVPPTVTTVAISPATVVGGQPSVATITINGSAPTGGMAVRLSSSSVALVVPASVTVPAGSRTTTANMTTSAVTTTATATVTATTAAVTATGTLTINPSPPRIVSISVGPSLVSNSKASVTVTFSRALDTITTIRIVSGDTLATPRFILDAATAGQTSRIVTFTPKPVAANRTVTLSAAMNGDSVRATTTVVPMTVDLKLSADSVIGTGTSTATVTLSAVPAVPVGLTVTSNQSSAVVPSSFAVSAGSPTGTFTISTFAVTADVRASIVARLQSTFGTAADTSFLSVIPATITSFTATPDSLLLPDAEPSFRTLTGSIRYAIPAPAGGVIIGLSSSAPMTSMPTTVLIPAGSNTATFTAVVSDNAQAGQYALTGTTQNGRTAQGPFRVARRPLAPEVASIVIPATQALGGASVNGTVTLTGPAEALTTIHLSAPTLPGGVASVAFQPVDIPVPQGQTTVTFTATGAPVGAATARQIGARRFTNNIGGTITRFDTLTVLPGAITSFTLPQSTLFSGQPINGTVTLSTPRGDVPVTATSSDTSVATVTAFGSPSTTNTVSVGVTPRQVGAPATATITVGYAGSTQTATITVVPASRLASVVLPSDPSLQLPFTATVSLTGPAPTGGATMSIFTFVAQGIATGSSSLQSTLTIPAGQTSTTFQVSPFSPRDASIVQAVVASYTPAGNPQLLGDSRSDSVEVRALTLDGGQGPGGGVFATLRSGDSLTVTVRTNLPAPTGGLTLTGTSAQPAAATITPSVVIPAGQSSATFRIVAKPVAASTQFQARVDAVSLSGSLFIFLTVNP